MALDVSAASASAIVAAWAVRAALDVSAASATVALSVSIVN